MGCRRDARATPCEEQNGPPRRKQRGIQPEPQDPIVASHGELDPKRLTCRYAGACERNACSLQRFWVIVVRSQTPPVAAMLRCALRTLRALRGDQTSHSPAETACWIEAGWVAQTICCLGAEGTRGHQSIHATRAPTRSWRTGTPASLRGRLSSCACRQTERAVRRPGVRSKRPSSCRCPGCLASRDS